MYACWLQLLRDWHVRVYRLPPLRTKVDETASRTPERIMMRSVRIVRPIALGAAFVAVAFLPHAPSRSSPSIEARPTTPAASSALGDVPVAHASGDGGAPL